MNIQQLHIPVTSQGCMLEAGGGSSFEWKAPYSHYCISSIVLYANCIVLFDQLFIFSSTGFDITVGKTTLLVCPQHIMKFNPKHHKSHKPAHTGFFRKRQTSLRGIRLRGSFKRLQVLLKRPFGTRDETLPHSCVRHHRQHDEFDKYVFDSRGSHDSGYDSRLSAGRAKESGHSRDIYATEREEKRREMLSQICHELGI